MHVDFRMIILGALGAALLMPSSLAAQQAPAPTDQQLTQTVNPGTDWITNGGALNNQRYSTLDQITPQNAASLSEVCPGFSTAGSVETDSSLISANGR